MDGDSVRLSQTFMLWTFCVTVPQGHHLRGHCLWSELLTPLLNHWDPYLGLPRSLLDEELYSKGPLSELHTNGNIIWLTPRESRASAILLVPTYTINIKQLSRITSLLKKHTSFLCLYCDCLGQALVLAAGPCIVSSLNSVASWMTQDDNRCFWNALGKLTVS